MNHLLFTLIRLNQTTFMIKNHFFINIFSLIIKNYFMFNFCFRKINDIKKMIIKAL